MAVSRPSASRSSPAGSKYLWLYPTQNLPTRHVDRFTTLRAGDLKTTRARAIKESLRHFWAYQRRGWAARHFTRWYFWATHSRLQPVIDAARTLKRHQPGLLSYFAHRISNAGAEGRPSWHSKHSWRDASACVARCPDTGSRPDSTLSSASRRRLWPGCHWMPALAASWGTGTAYSTTLTTNLREPSETSKGITSNSLYALNCLRSARVDDDMRLSTASRPS